MVESRYLQYEKKTKKVVESFTLGATRKGWRARGSCSPILEDTIGAFAASRFGHSPESLVRVTPVSISRMYLLCPSRFGGLCSVKSVLQHYPSTPGRLMSDGH